jgi:SP family general alpha glucoside:H+ symporter-like MFS transporter
MSPDGVILPYKNSEVRVDDEKFDEKTGAQHVEHVAVNAVPDGHHAHHDHVNITPDGVAHIDASVAAGVAANVEDYETLVREAAQATAREANMPLKEAFRTYPKVSRLGVSWSGTMSVVLTSG